MKHEKEFKGVSIVYHSFEYKYISIKHVDDELQTETKIVYDPNGCLTTSTNGDILSVCWHT